MWKHGNASGHERYMGQGDLAEPICCYQHALYYKCKG